MENETGWPGLVCRCIREAKGRALESMSCNAKIYQKYSFCSVGKHRAIMGSRMIIKGFLMLKVISIHCYLMSENYCCPRGLHFSVTEL